MQLGKYQIDMLRFFAGIGLNKWYTISRDGYTPRVAKSLEKKDLLVLDYDRCTITEAGMLEASKRGLV